MKYISDELSVRTRSILKNYRKEVVSIESRDQIDEAISEIDDILSQPEPQFQNGDVVYDENGVSYVYIGLHHKYDMASVIYHLEAEEYIDVPNNELYSEKPVTPKDGEWWMCKLTEGHPIRNVTAIYNGEHWYWDASFVVGHDRGIKPLYRMIRDTNTDSE